MSEPRKESPLGVGARDVKGAGSVSMGQAACLGVATIGLLAVLPPLLLWSGPLTKRVKPPVAVETLAATADAETPRLPPAESAPVIDAGTSRPAVSPKAQTQCIVPSTSGLLPQDTTTSMPLAKGPEPKETLVVNGGPESTPEPSPEELTVPASPPFPVPGVNLPVAQIPYVIIPESTEILQRVVMIKLGGNPTFIVPGPVVMNQATSKHQAVLPKENVTPQQNLIPHQGNNSNHQLVVNQGGNKNQGLIPQQIGKNEGLIPQSSGGQKIVTLTKETGGQHHLVFNDGGTKQNPVTQQNCNQHNMTTNLVTAKNQLQIPQQSSGQQHLIPQQSPGQQHLIPQQHVGQQHLVTQQHTGQQGSLIPRQGPNQNSFIPQTWGGNFTFTFNFIPGGGPNQFISNQSSGKQQLIPQSNGGFNSFHSIGGCGCKCRK